MTAEHNGGAPSLRNAANYPACGNFRHSLARLPGPPTLLSLSLPTKQ